MKTKRLELLVIIILLLIFGETFAQSAIFDRKTTLLSFQIGFGDYPNRKRPQDQTIFPNTMLVFDYGLTNEIGIGNFGIGGHVGFASANGKEPLSEADYNATFAYFGGRMHYHINFLKMTREPFFKKFDTYIGYTFGMGYRMVDIPGESTSSRYSSNLVMGCKYYLNSKTSLNLEILGGSDNCVYLGLGIKL